MRFEIFKKGKAEDLRDWTALPVDNKQRDKMQEKNISWWETNPMRYDFSEGQNPFKEFSKDYFEEIDLRFFNSVHRFMPWINKPFDNLVDYENLRDKKVLEIGVGCGSIAKLLAESSNDYTGIDITEYGVKATSERLACYKLNGQIVQMDAEKMSFENSTFDFIWSWGVVHHSSNTNTILKEMHRVLKPGGSAVTMVYHRSPWNTYVRGALYYGIIKRQFLKTRSINTIIQNATDGALARYYTVCEWNKMIENYFHVNYSKVYGSKSQLIPLPYGKTKEIFMSLIPDALGRFITNRPSVGFLLVSSFKK